MTEGRERKEDKRAVLTAPILRLEQEGDVCPVRDLERSRVRVNEGTGMVGDRGPRNWRWRVENTLTGRPQLEADEYGDEVERRTSPRLGDHPRILRSLLLETELDCGAGGERCSLSNKTQLPMQGKVEQKTLVEFRNLSNLKTS